MTPKHDFFLYQNLNAITVSAVFFAVGSAASFVFAMGMGSLFPLLFLVVSTPWVVGLSTSVMWESFVRESLTSDAQDWARYRNLPRTVKKNIPMTPRYFFSLDYNDRSKIINRLSELDSEYRRYQSEAKRPEIAAFVERIDSQISDYREHNKTLRELG